MCIVLVGGFTRADEEPTPAAIHSAADEADLDLDGPAVIERLKRTLEEVVIRQLQIDQAIRALHDALWWAEPSNGPRGPEIGSIGPVTLARSGRAVVRHAISWGQYPEDKLSIKVTASDDALVVPAKLELDFEKNEVRFEYEIRAGDKAGEFTITLTPATGEPVEVKVIVEWLLRFEVLPWWAELPGFSHGATRTRADTRRERNVL
jgi:hypothetical protein